MCLTIPGKIKEIKDGVATVENGSRTAQIDLGLVLDAKVGDWVLYATERAVKVISEQDAKEIISLLEENYRAVDAEKLPKRLKEIIFKVRKGQSEIPKEDIEYLLSLEEPDGLETLYAEANTLRKERIEDFVCIHGIIEFSNHCENNCLYCGIRKGNKSLERYRMSKEEILKAAKNAVEQEGYKLLVLQSGEDDFYSDDDLIEIIKTIRKELKVFVFISVGERSREFYKNAKMAGASGSLFRFETSNEKLYSKMRPEHELESRIRNLEYQKEQGFYIATGNLVGLPGQTISDIADDLLMIKKLGVPMISSGPFIPTKNTPLATRNSKLETRSSKEQLELFLKYIAVARLMMPEIKIPVPTALETLDPKKGRHRGLLAGANALMFNLTPEKFAGKYNIYDNKYREREKVWQKYGLFKGEESYEMLEERLQI